MGVSVRKLFFFASIFFFFFLFSAVFVFAAPFPITNPDFNVNRDGWSFSGSSVYLSSGCYSGGCVSVDGYMGQELDTPTGSYTVSFWYSCTEMVYASFGNDYHESDVSGSGIFTDSYYTDGSTSLTVGSYSSCVFDRVRLYDSQPESTPTPTPIPVNTPTPIPTPCIDCLVSSAVSVSESDPGSVLLLCLLVLSVLSIISSLFRVRSR